jgi:hypothetical protein
VTVRDFCEEDSSFGIRLYCYVPDKGSFWYEMFPDATSLSDEYASWLAFKNITEGVANCFADPMPLPCEGPYQVGGIDPAGHLGGVLDENSGWLYWTHEQALVFGQGLISIDETHTYDDMFGYWKSDASALNFTPAPTP